MSEQCPNCSQFKFEESTGYRLGCGLFLIFILPFVLLLAPSQAQVHGGYLGYEGIPMAIVYSVILGIILILLYFIFPSKTRKFKCKNCDFEQHYEK